ncbi:hypothetical protein DFJ73DRAFT_853605 [Zopfochytrium polystomum]|nr:hypothetical protein DFJ73DRAFT_853605 [Zopfochytrium polystomum]
MGIGRAGAFSINIQPRQLSPSSTSSIISARFRGHSDVHLASDGQDGDRPPHRRHGLDVDYAFEVLERLHRGHARLHDLDRRPAKQLCVGGSAVARHGRLRVSAGAARRELDHHDLREERRRRRHYVAVNVVVVVLADAEVVVVFLGGGGGGGQDRRRRCAVRVEEE